MASPPSFHVVCGSGSAEEVRSLLHKLSRHGDDVVNATNAIGVTPLHVACQRFSSEDTTEIIRALLDAGAPTDSRTRDGSSALHLACARGNLAGLELLTERGADVDAVDKSQRSVLHAAVKQGNIEVIERLIQLGANAHAVDKFGRSLLHVAVQRKSLEATALLVSAGVNINAVDSDGWSLLHVAVMGGTIELIEALVKEGADLGLVDQNGKSPLFLAVLNGAPIPVIEWLVAHNADVNTQDNDQRSLLHFVVEHGSIQVLELLVQHGARISGVDSRGKSILHAAVERGREDVLRFLITKKVDVNAVDEEGRSILHVAVAQEKTEIVHFLVRKGVDINAVDKNCKSLLHIAVESLLKSGGSIKMIEFLVNSGVNVNMIDSQNQTPLHVACYLNRFHEAVWYLLNNGAVEALTVEDDDGFCPLHIAAQNLNVHLVEMILNAGAEVNAHCRGGETALGIAFFVFNTNCEHAFPVAYLLCSRGAEWDASCDQRLSEGRARARDAMAESEVKDSMEAQEELREELRQELRWRLGLRECVLRWADERRASKIDLTKVSIEIINQGPQSVRNYLSDLDNTLPEDLVYRRKICVVGPSEWGKTSLVKSLTTMKPSLVHKDDRTIGIDLMECSFDQPTDIQNGSDQQNHARGTRKRHHVTFWDFAGQEIYQVAHSLFYSKRTLYLICVDLEAYALTLQESSAMSMRQGEVLIARFVRAHIFRWIRSIFSRQPDAEFVVVGTKSDQLKDSEAVTEIWRDLRMRLSDWQADVVKELENEHCSAVASLATAATNKSFAFLRAGTNDLVAQLDALRSKVIHTVSDDWLVVSNAERSSVLGAREALQDHLSQSDRCFEMTATYTRVLEIIQARCREARAMTDQKDRIENTILPYKALLRLLLSEIEGLKEGDCASILRTLHELGDVLWYEREGAGALKGNVILDPTLVLDFVREVVNHRRIEDEENGRNPDFLTGRVNHAALTSFPLWCNLDDELLHAFKLLLQYFQLAYPADEKEMDWDSDLIVPTYWKQARNNVADTEEDFLQRHGYSESDSKRAVCWEYELSGDVSETVFEHFAVQSYSALFQRTVHINCIESFVKGEFACRIGLHQADLGARDVIRMQVVTPSTGDKEAEYERTWDCMRYFAMTMEKVLETYSGLTSSPYIVDQSQGTNRPRYRVNAAVKTLVDAISMGRDVDTVRKTMPWLPRDLSWYIEKAWRHPGLLHEICTRSLLRELHSKVDVLKKLVVAGDIQRRYPALWTLEITPGTNLASLRLLSDLSGNCFHEPIEFQLPSSFFARHGTVMKIGLSVCSNVVPSVLTNGILQKVFDAAVSSLGDQIDHATRVHSCIDKLDFSASGVHDSGSSLRLSPRGSIAVLRELLQIDDPNFDELTIGELAKLQCAATKSGHYVWASRQEIMAMGERLTPCDPVREPRSPGSIDDDAPALQKPGVEDAPKERTEPTPAPIGKLRLVIDAVVGLPAWDWRRAYCQWRIVHTDHKAPLATGATSQHLDESTPPSWRDLSFTVTSTDLESPEKLRQCRLEVEIKRPSRLLGRTKVVVKGSVLLGDVILSDMKENFDSGWIEIVVDNGRKLIWQLASA